MVWGRKGGRWGGVPEPMRSRKLSASLLSVVSVGENVKPKPQNYEFLKLETGMRPWEAVSHASEPLHIMIVSMSFSM